MKRAYKLNEKRKHERVQTDMPFDFRLIGEPKISSGLALNASETGLLIHAIKDMPIGKKLTIEVLFMRGFELAKFSAYAEIVWKATYVDDDWRGYQYGLKFVQMPTQDYLTLKQIVGNRLVVDLHARKGEIDIGENNYRAWYDGTSR